MGWLHHNNGRRERLHWEGILAGWKIIGRSGNWRRWWKWILRTGERWRDIEMKRRRDCVQFVIHLYSPSILVCLFNHLSVIVLLISYLMSTFSYRYPLQALYYYSVLSHIFKFPNDWDCFVWSSCKSVFLKLVISQFFNL